MGKSIEDLKEIGFKEIGEWILNGENIDFNIVEDNSLRILYSFVKVENRKKEVIYIGKTIRTILNRMKSYRKPGNSQSTNIRLNKQIYDLLINKNSVKIYFFNCNEEVIFKNLKINLSAGLEDILIKKFKPKFNLHGNKIIAEDVELDDKTIKFTSQKDFINNQDNCQNSYNVTKNVTNSHLKGIINFGEVPIEYLPNFGEIINIYLGEIVFQANFTNGNQQGGYNPRINSVGIGRWLVENNINIGNTFYIKICNNNSFNFHLNEV